MIIGLRSLQAKLNKIKTIDTAQAVEASCERIESFAKANCPVDSGNLRASIRAEANKTHGEVTVGAPYASYVEFGTMNQKPQPFLHPAFNQNKKYILGDFKKSLERVIR